MDRLLHRAAIALALMLWGVTADAGAVPVELKKISHSRAQLEVISLTGHNTYTQDDLEAIGTMRMTTITPWREAPAAFDGVMLQDLLKINNMHELPAIKVTAENGYVVTIPSEIWERWPILIATRVNGRAHSRRARGPIQFIMPMSDDRIVGSEKYLENWVWMAARIEPAE